MLLQQQVGLGTIGTSEEGKLAYHMDATVLYGTIFYSNGLLRIFRFVFFSHMFCLVVVCLSMDNLCLRTACWWPNLIRFYKMMGLLLPLGNEGHVEIPQW